MTTVPQTRCDLLAARKAAAGMPHCASGYAGAVVDAKTVAKAGVAADAGVANAGAAADAGLATGAGAFAHTGVAAAGGDALAGFSGNIAPIAWHTAPRSRNLVALVVTPAA